MRATLGAYCFGDACEIKSHGDPPAVPRQLGDWAEESPLPMLLTVCIEAGRRTLTHTSWTGLTPGSRKWMSGQAAALAATQDRTPFANLSAPRPLRDHTLPSVRRPPSPLDFDLSWMSPNLSDVHRVHGELWQESPGELGPSGERAAETCGPVREPADQEERTVSDKEPSRTLQRTLRIAAARSDNQAAITAARNGYSAAGSGGAGTVWR